MGDILGRSALVCGNVACRSCLIFQNDVPARISRVRKDAYTFRDLQRVNYTRNVAQYCEHNVDEEIRIAPSLQENTEWRQEDGNYDFDNVTVRMGSINAQIRRIEGHIAAPSTLLCLARLGVSED